MERTELVTYIKVGFLAALCALMICSTGIFGLIWFYATILG